MAYTPGGKSPLTPLCKGGKGGILQLCTWYECTNGVWSDLVHTRADVLMTLNARLVGSMDLRVRRR